MGIKGGVLRDDNRVAAKISATRSVFRMSVSAAWHKNTSPDKPYEEGLRRSNDYRSQSSKMDPGTYHPVISAGALTFYAGG